MKRWLQNLGLVLFGLVLGLLFIEVLMRGAGLVYSYIQERENLASHRGKGGYKIICIGESTTVLGNYPRRLEAILNKWVGTEFFSVVNKGVIATTTQVLVDQMVSNIEKYRPNIVVAMMGINDSLDSWIDDYQVVVGGKRPPFYASLKTYKLLKSIVEHTLALRKGNDDAETRDGETSATVDEIGLAEEEENISITLEEALRCFDQDEFKRGAYICEQLLVRDPGNSTVRHLLANFYREIGRMEDSDMIYRALLDEAPFPPLDQYSLTLDYARMLMDGKRLPEALEMFKATVLLNPENTDHYSMIADFFIDHGFIRDFEELFGKIPLSANALLELAESIIWQNRYDLGVGLCRRAMELDPDNLRIRVRLAFFLNMLGGSKEIPDLCEGVVSGGILPAAYAELGQYHYIKGDETQAKIYFQKAWAADPEMVNSYIELGKTYAMRGWHRQAATIFQRALLASPTDVRVYGHLVDALLNLGENERAVKIARDAVSLLPTNDRVYGLLAIVLKQISRHDEAEQSLLMAQTWRKKLFSIMTVDNYRRLHSILRERGIPLVAVQYPMRSLAPLKLMLPDDEGVVFVDNEKIFREAVECDGYKTYFNDFFAGDFGHFTPRGVDMLAENIARTMIESGLFKKSLIPISD